MRLTGLPKPAPPTLADRTFASGNLVSTASDMQRWNRALLNAELLSTETSKDMYRIPDSQMHYASGSFVEPAGPIWHGGALDGYGTVNLLVPTTGHAIVILGNSQPGRWKPEEIARQIYNEASLGPPLSPFRSRARTTSKP
jgi:CubicO group peptidase (beta-lactamase class C family)